jgi:hypothetical protein
MKFVMAEKLIWMALARNYQRLITVYIVHDY